MFLFQGESTYTLMWDGKDEWSGVLWDHTIFQVWFQKGHVPALDFLRNVEKTQHERREREKAVADQAANTAAVMLKEANECAEQRRLKRARVNANNAKAMGGFPGGGTL